MIKTIIVCLISFLLGYVTTPYDPTETNKDAKLFQLIALAASIATVITLALISVVWSEANKNRRFHHYI